MKIFPAIDIRGGNAVRLFQGDYDQMTVYSGKPLDVAMHFKERGAKNLHLIDLDGAKDGQMVNFHTLKGIIEKTGMFTEVGGGIRDEGCVSAYLALGVNRVILGTAAVQNFDFLRAMVEKHGSKISVSVDVRDGFVAIKGWQEKTNVEGMAFCEKLRDAGVETVIYTDISKDGGQQGTNLEAYEELAKIKGLNVIASGGISFEHEITALRDFGIYAAILGKAMYSGTLDLATAIEIAEKRVII